MIIALLVGLPCLLLALVCVFGTIVSGMCWYSALAGHVLHSQKRLARFKYEFGLWLMNSLLYFYVGTGLL